MLPPYIVHLEYQTELPVLSYGCSFRGDFLSLPTVYLVKYNTAQLGRIAQSVQRLTTGWTVRGSNPGGARFSAVQAGPGAHSASCTMGNGSFNGIECGRGMTLNPHPFLVARSKNTGLFISPSGISELDCATTKIDTAERSLSIGRESLQVFFCTRGLGVLPGSTARG